MTTISQTIPSLGSPPLTTDPANFDTRADTLYGTSLPAVITATNTWSGQANTVAGEVNTNATNAATNATASATARTAAEAAQAAAQSASNATQWVSGQAYVAGNVVWSPSNYLSYRAVGATSGTTDPSQSASWVLLAVDVRRFTNPLAQAISVQMTASTTVGGIQQLDNDNLDMGTNDFTLHWEGALPDYTPAASIVLARKNTDGATAGWLWGVLTAGTMFITLRDGLGGAGTTYTSTAATAATDGSTQKLSVVIVRETASVAGSITYYVNGVQLGSALAITAGTAFTLNNALPLYVNGSATTRTAGSLQASRLFNRALTAAEVLDLSINVVALADRGATQAVTIENYDFEGGDTGWTSATVVDGELVLTISGNQQSGTDTGTIPANATVIVRAVIRSTGGPVIPQVRLTTGGLSDNSLTVFSPAAASYAAASVIEFTATNTGIARSRLWIREQTGVSGRTLFVDEIQVRCIGLTSELLASNAQSDTGQIFDSSGNKNHALLPASGATVVGRPVSQTREVRWTNTWDGTNELQYIGGVNQAILPANAYIESIVGTVSGATPHDIIIGDGSDADRYVTITTGLAAGTTSFTLAARTTDGTNLKLTVDPDTNATMSIAWVISYKTLES